MSPLVPSAGVSQLPRAAEPRESSPRHHDAWRQAMEHAQRQDWFKPAPPLADTARAPARMPASSQGPGTLQPHWFAALRPTAGEAERTVNPDAGASDEPPQGDGGASAVAEPGHRESAQPAEVGTASEPVLHGPRGAARQTDPADAPLPGIGIGVAEGRSSWLRQLTQQLSAITMSGSNAMAARGDNGPVAAPLASAALQMSMPPVAAGMPALLPAAIPGAAEQSASGAPFASILATEREAGRPAAALPASTAVRTPAAVHSPVRIHVDWLPAGAQVWLGLDRHRLSALPALIEHLQARLQADGVGLLTVVCNGRPVYSRFQGASR